MAVKINGFMTCTCGKIHALGGLSPVSRCKCGAKLWTQVFKQPAPVRKSA